MRITKQIQTLFAAAVVSLSLSHGAWAVDLNQAKANGWVCEQANGMLAAKGGPADVPAMVNSINARRQAEYQKIAAKRGIAAAQVGTITAQKIAGQNPQQMCK